MIGVVEEIFRHNNWANARLLDVCEGLDESQLDATAPGTYGKLRNILEHIVGAQERYAARLAGREPSGSLEDEGPLEFEELKRRALESGEELLALSKSNAEPEAIQTTFKGKDYRIDPKVILLQMINHSTEHREQVKAILSHLGVEAPNLDGWTYGFVTGLASEVTQEIRPRSSN